MNSKDGRGLNLSFVDRGIPIPQYGIPGNKFTLATREIISLHALVTWE